MIMDSATYLNSTEFDKNVERTMPFYGEFHRQTIELLAEMDYVHPRWLDTGCGTGLLIEKAIHCFPDAEFTLADPSEAMIKIASAKFAGNPQIRDIRVCGSQDLDYNEEYDIVTAIQCHHYLKEEERLEAIDKCFKALKQGGVLVVFEIISPDTEDGLKIAMKRWKTYQLAHDRNETEIDTHLARYGVGYFPISISTHFEILKNAGFKVVEQFWRSHIVSGFYAIKA